MAGGRSHLRTIRANLSIYCSSDLKNLNPDQRYHFHFGDTNQARSCRSLPSTLAKPLKIINGGDMMHTPEMMAAMTKAAAQHQPAVAILGGDLAYADGKHANRWPVWMKVWDLTARTAEGDCIPMIPAIGNHEVRGGYNRTAQEAPFFYSAFDLPENKPYYTCHLGDYATVVVLDSAHTTPIGGKQTEWLKGQLEQHQQRNYLIACYHFPAYGTTKAPRHSTNPIDNGISQALRKHWTPLFDQYHVDLALEHDHHTHKRSPPIKAGAVDPTGTLYIGDGAYGVQLRQPAPGCWYHAAASSTQHAWLITLEPDKLNVQAIGVDGKVFDETSHPSKR